MGRAVLLLAALAAAVAVPICSGVPVSVPPTATLPAQGLYLDDQNPSPDVTVKWELVGSYPTIGIHMANVPGTDQWVMVEKGAPSALPDPTKEFTSSSFFLDTGVGRNTSVLESNAFCGGIVQTSTDVLMMSGGHSKTPTGMPAGHRKIRLYFPGNNTWPDRSSTPLGRWYPTNTLLPNKKIFIIGGTIRTSEFGVGNPTYEIYDPQNPWALPQAFDLEPEHYKYAGQNYYPFQWVLPTGHIFNLIDRQSRFFTQDGAYVKAANGSYLSAPVTPGNWDTGFPRSGTAVMLGLQPDATFVEIVVFGGQEARFACPHVKDIATSKIAGRTSYRLKISWEKNGDSYDYTFGEWVEEDMGIPRVGGTATLLPNGDVVVSGGAQTGCMGGTLNNINRAGYINLWPELYQPEAAAGDRYTIMAASDIARVYHHTAGLTTNGTIVISGCDACNKNTLESAGEWWDPSPTSKNEYRVQQFHPPYALDDANKPAIKTIDGDADSKLVNITYGQEFTIEWEAFSATPADDLDVTNVSLVSASSDTHSFNVNQRVVFLEITAADKEGKTVTVKAPADANVAPPQYYMVFLVNGKTYSKARWIALDGKEDTTATQGV